MNTLLSWLKTKPYGLAVAVGILLAIVIFTVHRLTDKPESTVDVLSVEKEIGASAPVVESFPAESPATVLPFAELASAPAAATVPEPSWGEHEQRLAGLDQDVANLKFAVDELQQQIKALQATVNMLNQPAPVSPTTNAVKKPVKKRRAKPKSVRPTSVDIDAKHVIPSALQGFNNGQTIEAVNRWGEEKRVLVKSEQGYQQLKLGDVLGNSTIESIQIGRIVLKNANGQILLRLNSQGQYE